MMPATWSAFWAEQSDAFWTALGEHVFLTLLSTSLAVLLGVGLGMLIFRWRALQRPVLGLAGEIHLFPEYTGTAMTAILKEERVPSLDVYAFVRDLYQRRYQLKVFPPLGFNNSYVLTMRGEQAEALGIRRLSDLKEKGRKLRAAVDFEFAGRRDGLKGLTERYGIRFASVRDIDPTIIYDVLASGQADIISAYGTDGRISTHGFLPLEDDLDFFPPYHAVIVARQDVLRRHPKLAPVLRQLSGTIDDTRMRRMNYAVDHDHVPVAEVARAFLAEQADD